jgi:outer membrane receptor for monomeric catechols
MTKMKLRLLPKFNFVLYVFFGLLLLLPVAQGQQQENEEIIELSPFEVSSTGDIGYLATSTLAGSRINAQLRDTAASVSVFTEEFIRDLGAIDLQTVLSYSVSAETSVGDVGQNPSGNDNVDAMPTYNFRVRGFNSTRSRNYFRWDLTIDTYNTERLDESRGPNSILFGVGSAGGIINTTTKRARIGRDITNIQLSVGSWENYRGTLDVNREIIPDKLALRANFLAETGKSWQHHVRKDDRRMHLATIFRPFRNTNIRVEFEKGRLNDVVSRPFHILDGFSQWDGTLYDSFSWEDEPGARRSRWWAASNPVFVGNNNEMVDMLGLMESVVYFEPLENFDTYSDWWNQATLDSIAIEDSFIPKNISTDGPGAKRFHDFWTYTATVEQRLFKDLHIELSAHKVDSEWISHWSGLSTLQVDVANLRRDGTSNPYAGQYYIQGGWDRRTRTIDTESLRATASYKLDLDRLGVHNFVGMFGKDRDRLGFTNEFEGITSEEIINPFGNHVPAWGGTPDDARYQITRRQYVELGDWKNFHIPSWEVPIEGLAYRSVGANFNGKPVDTGWIPRGTSQNDDTVTTMTYLGAIQSYFLRDRLVTTLGFRRDSVDNRTHVVSRDERGYYAINYARPVDQKFISETKTIGLVAHLSKQLSLFYNVSDNSNYPNFLIKVLPDDLTRPFDGVTPNPASGLGWDTGVMFNLLDGRISGRVTYFAADVKDNENWTGGYRVVTTMNSQLNNGLRQAGVIDQDEVDFRTHTATGTLFDEQSKGIEFSTTANLTSNWRLQLNYSYTDRDRTNSYADAQRLLEVTREWAYSVSSDYIAENQLGIQPGDLLLGQPPLPGDPDQRSRLHSHFESWQSDIDFYQRMEEIKRGLRKHKFNVFTAYDIVEGPLKGLTVGGGIRFQGKNIVGVDGLDNILMGRSINYLDLMFRYDFGTRLIRGARTSIQLNVRNVLNKNSLIPIRYAPVPGQDYSYANIIDRYTYQQPREFVLSMNMNF